MRIGKELSGNVYILQLSCIKTKYCYYLRNSNESFYNTQMADLRILDNNDLLEIIRTDNGKLLATACSYGYSSDGNFRADYD